jgi:hypothetical protein
LNMISAWNLRLPLLIALMWWGCLLILCLCSTLGHSSCTCTWNTPMPSYIVQVKG